MKECANIFPPLNSEEKRPLSGVQKEILKLKKQKDAIILAHSYVEADIQDVADFVGDSLGLSRRAKEAKEKVIVFCGVHFMAETAKILNPSKTVILPDTEAGCSLADSCKYDDLAALKAEHPDAIVVSYINCSADIKTLSDIICTSGNALELVKKIPESQKIIFAPDKYLGGWINEKLGRNMILWDGSCYAHEEYDAETIKEMKAQYGAPALAHPECPKPVRDAADEVCSTEKMISWCKNHPSDTFIIVTITGMIHRLRKEIPNKTFIAARLPEKCCRNCQNCKYMLLNTPKKLLKCLQTLSPEITLPPETIEKAYKPISRMLGT